MGQSKQNRRRGRRRRRWLTLCLLTMVCALSVVVLAGYARMVRSNALQHRAAMELEAKGAELTWRPIEPAWWRTVLQRVLEPALARQCIAVHAEHAGLEDADLAWVRHLPHLEKLYLADNPIGDQGLVHLRGLRNLERLSLWGTEITDDGMRHVGQLKSLKVLDIHDSSLYHRFGSVPAGHDTTTLSYPRTSSRFLSCRFLQYLMVCGTSRN